MTTCLRCGRGLRAPSSVARGYGSSCWKVVGRAACSLLESSNKAAHKAAALLLDGGVRRTRMAGVYLVPSSCATIGWR